jgi:four helix bundle protein
MILSFEDVVAWQKSKELSNFVYKTFRDCKDYSFRDQIQRAALSVMNNIAEGFERKSNKELPHFLYISKGSCGEVRSMTYMAFDLGYMNKTQMSDMCDLCREISRILAGFIKSV